VPCGATVYRELGIFADSSRFARENAHSDSKKRSGRLSIRAYRYSRDEGLNLTNVVPNTSSP
jgi:hypothetical protein